MSWNKTANINILFEFKSNSEIRTYRRFCSFSNGPSSQSKLQTANDIKRHFNMRNKLPYTVILNGQVPV
jgi:hypothetical protein